MKNISKIILILSVTLGILALYSFMPKPVSIGEKEIKQSKIKLFFTGDTSQILIYPFCQTVGIKEQTIDSSSQNILLIGDSMLEQLRWRLRDYCKENNHQMNSVIWYSSQSKWFGTTDTLKYFINKFNPSYIILVLGANELFVRNIKEERAPYVKHILDQIGDIPYVWVGPPNWAEDTGINELILRNVGSKRYFPSKDLKYKRFPDGAHPRPESAFMWMDSIAKFIQTKSKYPILMEFPTQKYSGSPNSTILQPWK